MKNRQLNSTYLSFILLFILVCAVKPNKIVAQNAPSESEESLPSFEFGGFLQQQLIIDQTSDSPTRFSIHRARLGMKGTITDRITVNLIGGYAEPPNNTPRLVNAFIDFDIHPLLQLRTGQFLLPFGMEGPQPIFLNPSIERSNAIRRLNTFSMFRDVGIQISGHYSIFDYAVALVNGKGANQPEQIEPKDIMGRLGISLTDNIKMGVSGHLGYYQPDPASDNHESRFRAGIDAGYEKNPVFIKGEYVIRQDDQPTGNKEKMNGGYLLGGYQFTNNVEIIARYEYFEPNTSSNDDHLTAFVIGANYYFVGNTRLSLNYEFIEDRLNPIRDNMLTVQMQVAI